MQASHLSAAAACVALAATGCNNYVFSPPARSAPLETAATLPRGDTGVQLEGGAHGAIFGLSGESGTVRVRRGVATNTDASIEANVLHIDGSGSADTNPMVYSGRVGVKQRLVPFFSLTGGVGGVGGGGSVGGGFLSPDLGAIVAWENRYFIPFLSLRASVSQPIGARPVDTSSGSEAIGTHVYTPRLTFAGGGTGGFRIPIGDSDARGKLRASILSGLSITHLADQNDKDTVVSLTGGAEIAF